MTSTLVREENSMNMAVEGAVESMAPVHMFSHGSPMMLGEEHASADYWEECGKQALANGIEHVVMMGGHWSTSIPSAVLISANPQPVKSPMPFVHSTKYSNYELRPDLDFLPTITAHLEAAGIRALADPKFDWIHDTYLVLIRMFPQGCPPTTLISMNDLYDPHFHMSLGVALRPLRARKYKTLFIGSGGSVHNLYRNSWGPMLRYRDNFAQPTPPGNWALDFRQDLLSAICPGHEELLPLHEAKSNPRKVRSTKGSGGPLLRKKITSLMKHPLYRDAHGTDDHFMANLFVAGLCGGKGDENMMSEMGAEDWELTNICNSQYTLGSWSGYRE